MMWAIPEWMARTDFPYKPKPFPSEVPFADGLTVVRLLGGWKMDDRPGDRRSDENDLADRDAEGRVFYRWNLLKERLDPYVERGYELTLVLDNVPYALAREPDGAAGFGQVSPPADLQEWEDFIQALCEELVVLYGAERANGFRFRLGTEMQDERRFSGTQEEYFAFYDHTARAVKSVLPGAKFGPFNRSIPKCSFTTFEGYTPGNVSILALAEHAAKGTNRATGEVGSPFDFLARSLYYFTSFDEDGNLINVTPDERLPEIQLVWDRASKIDPRFADISREVQELGPNLQTEGEIYSLDTGVRGAAQTFETLIGLREIGADRIWHWEVFEAIDKGRTLLRSQGWLYAVLDTMRGGEAFVLPVEAAPDHGNRHTAVLSVKEDEAILVVSTWHPDRVKKETDSLRMEIPGAVLPADFEMAGALDLREDNWVYDVIRSDLAASGHLSAKHREHRGAPAADVFSTGYSAMADSTPEARAFIDANWPRYASLMMGSLQMKPFAGAETQDADGRTLSLQAFCPSVQVIVWRRAKAGSAAAPIPAAADRQAGLEPLGKLTPFWRYGAALGPFHEVGQGLDRIPDYVLRGDFPYRKRPFPLEYPFADHLSLVRILGGFNDGSLKGASNPEVRERDLAYRDESGAIQTRFELLGPRLEPYLENGYEDFTVVLDNVPWCFPESPNLFGLGQNMGPRDLQEWHQFVGGFCRELERVLPASAREKLRFRVGTEMNGIERFGGTQEDFFAFYDATVAAVHDVFPQAPIGFYNISGAQIFGIDQRHNVNSFALTDHILNTPNSFLGRVTPPPGWIAFSRYFSMGVGLFERSQGAVEVWDEFENRFPALEGVSREIHEFGVAPFGEGQGGDGFVSQESGALGAASTAIMVARLRAGGLDKLWHWGGEIAAPFRSGQNVLHHLFTGVGWFYQVLDTLVNQDSFLLEPLEPTSQGTEILALAAMEEHALTVIIPAYPVDPANPRPETVRFALPSPENWKGKPLQMVRLNAESDVYRRIRNDLQAQNLLKPEYLERPHRLGTIRQMSTGREGEVLVGERLEEYHQLYVDSLTLKPAPQNVARLIDDANGNPLLEVTLSPPEVLTIVIR
jgi:hypothetical protein